MGLPIGTGGVNRRPVDISTLKTEQEAVTPPHVAGHSGPQRWRRDKRPSTQRARHTGPQTANRALRPCLPVSRDILWHILLALASYRVPRPVTERVVFPDCSGVPSYYECPRCGITLEREFAAFCDRCGQRLGWRGCREAKIIVRRAVRRWPLN